MLVITHLSEVGIWGAAPLRAALMATNATRMVTATSMVTESSEPLHHFGTVGIIAAGLTIARLWLAVCLRPAA